MRRSHVKQAACSECGLQIRRYRGRREWQHSWPWQKLKQFQAALLMDDQHEPTPREEAYV